MTIRAPAANERNENSPSFLEGASVESSSFYLCVGVGATFRLAHHYMKVVVLFCPLCATYGPTSDLKAEQPIARAQSVLRNNPFIQYLRGGLVKWTTEVGEGPTKLFYS